MKKRTAYVLALSAFLSLAAMPVSANTGGYQVTNTGDSQNDVSVKNQADTNTAHADGGKDGRDGTKINESGNGAFSDNTVRYANDNNVRVNQNNDTNTHNNVDVKADTGNNNASDSNGNHYGWNKSDDWNKNHDWNKENKDYDKDKTYDTNQYKNDGYKKDHEYDKKYEEPKKYDDKKEYKPVTYEQPKYEYKDDHKYDLKDYDAKKDEYNKDHKVYFNFDKKDKKDYDHKDVRYDDKKDHEYKGNNEYKKVYVHDGFDKKYKDHDYKSDDKDDHKSYDGKYDDRAYVGTKDHDDHKYFDDKKGHEDKKDYHDYSYKKDHDTKYDDYSRDYDHRDVKKHDAYWNDYNHAPKVYYYPAVYKLSDNSYKYNDHEDHYKKDAHKEHKYAKNDGYDHYKKGNYSRDEYFWYWYFNHKYEVEKVYSKYYDHEKQYYLKDNKYSTYHETYPVQILVIYPHQPSYHAYYKYDDDEYKDRKYHDVKKYDHDKKYVSYKSDDCYEHNYSYNQKHALPYVKYAKYDKHDYAKKNDCDYKVTTRYNLGKNHYDKAHYTTYKNNSDCFKQVKKYTKYSPSNWGHDKKANYSLAKAASGHYLHW